jgi:hypothetical protein
MWKNHNKTHRRKRAQTNLAFRNISHKLLLFDRWEGVMVKIPRRKTVKNTQVGLCGDMHVFHGQCTATIQEREARHSPNLMWCGMLSNTSRRRRVCFRTCTDGWCTTCQHPVSIDSPGSPHVVSRGQGHH